MNDNGDINNGYYYIFKQINNKALEVSVMK